MIVVWNFTVKVKVKFSHHTHEIIWRSVHVLSPISSPVVFAPRPLYRRSKSSGYPLNRKFVYSQGWSGRFGEEINPLFVLGLEPRLLWLLPRSLLTIPTTLLWLRKNVYYIARDMDKVFKNRGLYGCCSECFDTKKNYSRSIDVLFLGAFRKLRKATLSFVKSVRLSLLPRGTTRLLLDGFSWNLILECFF